MKTPMHLDKLIGKLLLHTNCVVVPNFGGFVASRVPAKIDRIKGTISSPYKTLLFNKQLISNDGLLNHAFAQENNCSFEDAAFEVENQVKIWQQDLAEGKRIALEQIGFLFLNNEKNLCFEQDQYHNLLLSSFGLGTVHFVSEQIVLNKSENAILNEDRSNNNSETPIIQFKQPLEQKIIAKISKPARPIRSISAKRIVKYAVAACLLPIGFYSIWIPIKTDVLESGLISSHDFNPFHSKSKATYKVSKKLNIDFFSDQKLSLEKQIEQLPASVTHYSFNLFEDGNYYSIKIKDTEITPKKIESSQSFIEATSQQTLANIQVLAGSFSNEGNAQILQKELISLGFSAFTYRESNGLTRVSAGKFSSTQEAQQAVKTLAEAGKSTWILK